MVFRVRKARAIPVRAFFTSQRENAPTLSVYAGIAGIGWRASFACGTRFSYTEAGTGGACTDANQASRAP